MCHAFGRATYEVVHVDRQSLGMVRPPPLAPPGYSTRLHALEPQTGECCSMSVSVACAFRCRWLLSACWLASSLGQALPLSYISWRLPPGLWPVSFDLRGPKLQPHMATADVGASECSRPERCLRDVAGSLYSQTPAATAPWSLHRDSAACCRVITGICSDPWLSTPGTFQRRCIRGGDLRSPTT